MDDVIILPEDFSKEKYGLHVRFVNTNDAAFIYSLRTNETLSKYIHAVEGGVNRQIEWIQEYKKRERQGLDYYFIFENKEGIPLGVCRIYHIENGSFTTGSWVFSKEAPLGAAILGDIITREIAYELFPSFIANFSVNKSNTSVLRYTLSYKPRIVFEDDISCFFVCDKDSFIKKKEYYINHLVKHE